MSAVGEPPVGEVGLPALVGQFGGKPDVGGLGSPLGCGCRRACGAQMAVDGWVDTVRPWWCLRCQAMVWGPLSRPLLASFSCCSTIRSIVDCGSRVGLVLAGASAGRRRARPRVVARNQPGDPGLRNPIGAGHLGLAAPLHDDGGDDQPRLRHRRKSRHTYSDVLRHAIRMSWYQTLSPLPAEMAPETSPGAIFMPDGHVFGHIS